MTRRWSWGIVLGLGGLLVAARIAAPYAIAWEIERELDKLPDYDSSVDDVDLGLWRGAARVEGLRIVKQNGEVRLPFVDVRQADLRLDWSALLRGAVVARIVVHHPEVNVVVAPAPSGRQTKPPADLREKLVEMIPIKIDRLEVKDGVVRYHDFHAHPKVDVELRDVYATVVNLTNSYSLSKTLVASGDVKARTTGNGQLEAHIALDPYAKQPRFDLDARLVGLDLRAVNDFLRAYAKLDVERGTFTMFTEIAAANGRFSGYVKPFLEDVDVVRWKSDSDNPFQLLWETVVGVAGDVFKNAKRDQVATRIPISGKIDDPAADVWTAVGNTLRNAFIQALVPRLEHSITLVPEGRG